MKFQAAIVVIVLDVAFGTLSALKLHSFRLSYFSDFARNDIAFKLVPWAGIYVAAKFAGNQQLVIPGVDLDTAQTAFYVAIMAAWSGSLLNSFRDLGVPVAKTLPVAVAGDENAAPPKD
jgi:hypothetical protein